MKSPLFFLICIFFIFVGVLIFKCKKSFIFADGLFFLRGRSQTILTRQGGYLGSTTGNFNSMQIFPYDSIKEIPLQMSTRGR